MLAQTYSFARGSSHHASRVCSSSIRSMWGWREVPDAKHVVRRDDKISASCFRCSLLKRGPCSSSFSRTSRARSTRPRWRSASRTSSTSSLALAPSLRLEALERSSAPDAAVRRANVVERLFRTSFAIALMRRSFGGTFRVDLDGALRFAATS